MKNVSKFDTGVPRRYTNEVLFHVALIAYAVVIILDSRALQPDAALVPRMMAVGLIATALARIVAIVASGYIPDQLLNLGFDPDEMADLDSSNPGAIEVLTIIAWVIAYVAFMYVLGIVIGTFLFVLLFTYLWGNEGLLISIAYSVLMAAFIQVVFSRFLRINLRQGIVDFPFL